jgi:hypothetical protein
MMTENIRALVAYRLEQADESLKAKRNLPDKLSGLCRLSVHALVGWFFLLPLIALQ